MTKKIDEQFLKLINGDSKNKEEAFRLLVDTFGPILYRQIRAISKSHELTNDILQEVFIKVYTNISNFKGDSALYTWLYRITRNETLNYLEKENRRSGVDLDDPVFEISLGSVQQNNLTSEEIEELFFSAIDSLPEKQASVFRLKYFEELKYSEISDMLNTSEGALKASYFHAKEKITTFLKNKLNH